MAFWFYLLWWIREPASGVLLGNQQWLRAAISLSFGPIFLVIALVGAPIPSRFRAPVGLTLLYLAWMGISLWWTQADNVKFAFFLWFSFACEVLAALLISQQKGQFARALSGMITGSFILGAIMAVAIWQDPMFLFPLPFRAETTRVVSKNLFGSRIAMGALAALFFALNGRRRMRMVAAVLTALLILTTSKTCIVIALLVGSVYVLKKRGVAGIKVLVLGGIAALAAAPVVWVYFEAWYSRPYSAVTLTGRVPLWLKTIGFIQKQPFTGYGFLSFADMSGASWAIHAHNDYLQQLVTLGIVGLALFLLLHFSLYRRLRHSVSPYAPLGMIWLAYAIGRGFFDSDMLYFSLPLHMLVLLYAMAASRVRVVPVQRAPSLPGSRSQPFRSTIEDGIRTRLPHISPEHST